MECRRIEKKLSGSYWVVLCEESVERKEKKKKKKCKLKLGRG